MVVNPEKIGTYIDGPVVQESKQEEVMSHFRNWEDDVEALLKVS